jgi:hypothetical protein
MSSKMTRYPLLAILGVAPIYIPESGWMAEEFIIPCLKEDYPLIDATCVEKSTLPNKAQVSLNCGRGCNAAGPLHIVGCNRTSLYCTITLWHRGLQLRRSLPIAAQKRMQRLLASHPRSGDPSGLMVVWLKWEYGHASYGQGVQSVLRRMNLPRSYCPSHSKLSHSRCGLTT